MRLSAPKKGTFSISLIVGLVAILYHYGLARTGSFSIDFLLLSFSFVLLLLGTLFKGV